MTFQCSQKRPSWLAPVLAFAAPLKIALGVLGLGAVAPVVDVVLSDPFVGAVTCGVSAIAVAVTALQDSIRKK